MSQESKSQKAGKSDTACGHCRKAVTEQCYAMQCTFCSFWYHIECESIKMELYNNLCESNHAGLHWYCRICNVKASGVLASLVQLESNQQALQRKIQMVEAKQTEQDNKHAELVETQRRCDMKVNDVQERVNNLENRPVPKTPPNTQAIASEVAKNLQEDALKEMEDRKAREDNIIIYGLEELNSNIKEERYRADKTNVQQFLEELRVDFDVDEIIKMLRLGKPESNPDGAQKVRPLLVTFTNSQVKKEIFKNVKDIRDLEEKFKNLSVSNDLTKKQREENRKLVAEAKQKEEEEGQGGRYKFKVKGPPWARKVVKISNERQWPQWGGLGRR